MKPFRYYSPAAIRRLAASTMPGLLPTLRYQIKLKKMLLASPATVFRNDFVVHQQLKSRAYIISSGHFEARCRRKMFRSRRARTRFQFLSWFPLTVSYLPDSLGRYLSYSDASHLFRAISHSRFGMQRTAHHDENDARAAAPALASPHLFHIAAGRLARLLNLSSSGFVIDFFAAANGGRLFSC